MPLTTFLLNRNNYGMAMHELYNEETVVINNEDDSNTDIVDSKALLDSLSVSSLVSILRHLADLSQFAAEVFHGLQGQVAATASRSHKLASRVQQVEAFLPQIEKAFLSQTSHMHYVYTPGSEWHARIRNEKNHFIYDDLPHFIMDSYEECREPPRLHKLDRFDTGGPGSCLKRYSDPTFFKRAPSNSKVPNGKKSLDERDSRRIKRRRSWQQSGCFPDFAPTLDCSGRLQLSSSTFQEQFSVSQTGSTSDPTFKSDLRDKSDSPASKNGTSDFIECVFHPSTLIQPDNTETNGICSDLNKERVNEHVSLYLDEHTASMKATLLKSSSMRWDGKVEIVRHVLQTDFASNEEENGMEVVCQVGTFSEGENDDDESETDHFVDALNTIESESESDFERHTNTEKVLISSPNDELLESPLNEQMQIDDHHEPKHACHSLSHHNEESSHDDSRRSKPTIFSILNMEHSDPDASTNVSDSELRDIQQEPNITSPWSNNSENKSNDAISHSSRSSPPLSPQLEHMKISHRHINVSEASILTLKYLNEVDNRDISIDTFSSFQLVPESVNLKHDIGSGSDDNNDYLRDLSDSNSEESGTEDDSAIDYNGLSNGLNSISLTESTSSSPRCGQTALRRINVGATFVNEVHSQSDCSSERPPIMVGNDSIADQGLTYFEQPTPETPPLPPLQWRVSKLQLNAEVRKQDHGSINVNQSPGDNRSHLAAMDSARLLNSSDDESVTVLKENEERDEPKVHFRNKFHQVVNEKREDEKGDFLHQIRTKSYNLRRTVPVRATYTTSSATSNKVTAILQKANAIRRAVGSDGEDDSWSDT